MEQNLPVIAKRIWSIVRVVLFMLRKGIPKRKLIVDLNMLLKRGKIAGAKAIGHLMFHHHHGRQVPAFADPPREYEFSCSNTPAYTFPFHTSSKKKSAHHHFFPCAHAPLTNDDDVATTANAVKAALEMLNSYDLPAETASPFLPGFGRTPLVRPLRVTDSPFPLRDTDEDNGYVDKAAEEFIRKFYNDLKLQKRMSDCNN